MTAIPKLAMPFTVSSSGAVATVEQGSDEEVEQCVVSILRTAPGDRNDYPDMGIPDFAFREGGADLDIITTMLGEYEPRYSVMPISYLTGLINFIQLEGQRPKEGTTNA